MRLRRPPLCALARLWLTHPERTSGYIYVKLRGSLKVVVLRTFAGGLDLGQRRLLFLGTFADLGALGAFTGLGSFAGFGSLFEVSGGVAAHAMIGRADPLCTMLSGNVALAKSPSTSFIDPICIAPRPL